MIFKAETIILEKLKMRYTMGRGFITLRCLELLMENGRTEKQMGREFPSTDKAINHSESIKMISAMGTESMSSPMVTDIKVNSMKT